MLVRTPLLPVLVISDEAEASGRNAAAEFESWVYDNEPSLVAAFGEDVFLDLCGIDFRTPKWTAAVRLVLRKFDEDGALDQHRSLAFRAADIDALHLACGSGVAALTGLAECYRLYLSRRAGAPPDRANGGSSYRDEA
jgi:hypothetical protein